MPRRRDKALEREVGLRRVRELLDVADRWSREGRDADADRAVDLARRVAERTRLGYPPELKLRMCRGCHRYVGASKGRRRLTGGRVTTTCLACGRARRVPTAARSRREE